ncbi:hypothetical protein RCC89_12860 [Cytophagaceae bacterium ABcell3]|nr:hypothetical protein RCC89_12860 [Cytophagaceae bacterium ABcell3]
MDLKEKHIPTKGKVEFLKDIKNFPEEEKGSDITVNETHMSWVFLTEKHVYKMKKPVKYSFLDFSTLEKRKYNCEVEVRLNRRLAPDVYEGVIPMTLNSQGQLQLSGHGVTVEWLVKMKRLPQKSMLEYKIQNNTLQKCEVFPVAQLLASFYLKQEKEHLTPEKFLNNLIGDIDNNLKELENPLFQVKPSLLIHLKNTLTAYIDNNSQVLHKRVGKVVEAHGDLRPEHIYVNQSPKVIDCLEFNRDLRILDPAEELSYLSLECDMLNASWTGHIVLQEYQSIAHDYFPSHLVDFYKSKRAVLRSLLCFRHITEPNDYHREKWKHKGIRYLEVASEYADKVSKVLQ